MTNREDFFFVIGRELPTTEATDVRRLLRLAAGYHRLAVEACNRQLTEREMARQAKLRESLEAWGWDFGATICCDGDPRGYVVKIMLPSGIYNTWGGAEEGWGVPR